MVKMVQEQYQINRSSTIDHTAKRGKDKETKQLDSKPKRWLETTACSLVNHQFYGVYRNPK